MLERLEVREYALIDHISLPFEPGFTVLTGETGAGKSILVGALGLLLGFRGDTTMIRTGSEQAEVYGVIRIEPGSEAEALMDRLGIETEEGTILVRRVLKKSGRGTIYIQSTPVTLSQLMEIMSLIFDMHGQHEHQSLLVLENHRKFLDRYGNLAEKADRLHAVFSELSDLRKQFKSLASSERDRLREIDILTYAIDEIDKAELVPGEEETLRKERTILQQHEKLFSLIDTSYENASESRGGALSRLRLSKEALQGAAEIDTALTPLYQRIESTFYELEDIAESLRSYRQETEFSAERLREYEERLAMIHDLEKKYGSTIGEVLDYRSQCEERLRELENWESDKENLQLAVSRLEKELLKSAKELSEKREHTAKILQEHIQKVMQVLGMPKAQFIISVTKKVSDSGKPVCGPYGYDAVEILISPNQGEGIKPLKDIVSGGEMSRIMLAIKSVLAGSDHIRTLIFDEIDAGIGGEVANAVGEHLAALAEEKQVLCITHLASLAARADNHIKIEKSVYDNRTVTGVDILDREGKIKEISRMLAGDSEGEVSLTHAQELLKKFSSKR